MRREDLVDGAREILPTLELAVRFFNLAIRRSRGSDVDLAETLSVYHRVRTELSGLSESGRVILEELDLEADLVNPLTWNVAKDNSSDQLVELHHRLTSSVNGFNRVLPLLADTEAQKVRNAIASEKSARLGWLQVTILEDEAVGSTPERLCEALTAISDLYEVAVNLNATNIPLSVVGCDSGSDKSFDFTGAGKALENVKEFIIALWDRVVYYKQNQTARNIELLTQGLPVLAQIDALRESKSIDPEVAEQLKKKVIRGCTKFLDAGCTIPEISDHASVSPRALLQPEPKMLNATNPQAPSDSGGESEGGEIMERSNEFNGDADDEYQGSDLM